MRKFGSLRRKVELRAPKKKFVIFTEGRNTEPEYFEALRSVLRGALVEIEIIGAAGVPKTIATKAADRSKQLRSKKVLSSFEEQDEIWAVFDRDEHPLIPEAMQQCSASKVEVAFSNPCFELWLILHFEDYDRPDHRSVIQKHLEKLCPEYSRNARKTANCVKLMELLDGAEQRAEVQLRRRLEEGDPPSEPFTTVFKLTRNMRAADAAHEKPSTPK